MKKLLGKIAAIVLLLGLLYSVLVFVFLPFEIARKLAAESWPARQGVVTDSRATYHRGGFGRAGASYYKAEICGMYGDGGGKFCVSRIRYGGFRWGEGEKDARDTVARYPKSSEIEIHYNPDDPRETVLEAKSPWSEIIVLLGLAVAFPLIPLLLWLLRNKPGMG